LRKSFNAGELIPMNQIKTSKNPACRLWNKKDLTTDDLVDSLEKIKSYEDDSHLIRTLKKCKECGQLFFYEFYEEVDWAGGNDPQYRTWIPVDDETAADSLDKLSGVELQQFPRIIADWPSENKNPSPPRKIA
jgi:hypothetical protein